MTRLGSVLAVAVAAAGAGCMGHGAQGAQRSPAQSQTQAQPPSASDGRGMAMMETCPLAVPGTQVAAADTEDGEAITFTTTSPDAVQDLRRRVHAMADMHNRHMEGHAGMEGMHGGMGGTGAEGSAGSGYGSEPPAQAQGEGTQEMQGMHPMMPPSRATAEDVDGGARVTVTPDSPADAEALRSAIRAHVDRMRQTGSCAMDHG